MGEKLFSSYFIFSSGTEMDSSPHIRNAYYSYSCFTGYGDLKLICCFAFLNYMNVKEILDLSCNKQVNSNNFRQTHFSLTSDCSWLFVGRL